MAQPIGSSSSPADGIAESPHIGSTSSAADIPHITARGGQLLPSGICSRRIRRIFEERLDMDGSTWVAVTDDTKKFYFDEFRKYFAWEEAMEKLVHIAWEHKVAERYSDMLYDMRKQGKRAKFVPEETWRKWDTDWANEHFKQRARQNAANRSHAATHTGGSVTFSEHAERMRSEMGRDPTPIELFRHAHSRGHDRQTFIDEKARQINETYETMRQSQSQPELGSSSARPVDEVALYYEAVGGAKKNLVYGMGSQASAFYPSTSASSGSRAPTSDLHYQQLLDEQIGQLRVEMEQQIEQMRRQQAQEHEQAQMQMRAQLQVQIRAEMQTQMRAEMQTQIRAILSRTGQDLPPMPPEDPSGDL